MEKLCCSVSELSWVMEKEIKPSLYPTRLDLSGTSISSEVTMYRVLKTLVVSFLLGAAYVTAFPAAPNQVGPVGHTKNGSCE